MSTLTSKRAKHAAIALALLVVAIALATGIGKTLAYFTTYAEAKGSVEITLGDKTQITEEFDSWTKSVVITNTPDAGTTSQPVFVRVKAFSGSTYPLVYEGDKNWTPGGDGYYYYRPVLASGESTSVLKVKINDVPKDPTIGDNFNVVIIYETTPVYYDEAGNPKANWNVILDNGNISQGGGK